MQTAEHYPVTEATHFDHEARRYEDTVTWLAEVLPSSMRTVFEYGFDGSELYASDGGALEPIFMDALRQAQNLPDYEVRRRRHELDEYEDMLDMMSGHLPNTMVVLSDFPPELMDAAEDVGGYNVGRKQTMLRVIYKTPEGTLKMSSQSLDGSHRRSLESLYEHFGQKPETGELLGQRLHMEMSGEQQQVLLDELVGVYDRDLSRRMGGQWYAGRLGGSRHNAYDFVRRQTDLLGAYFATTKRFTGGFKDYSLAAAMVDRFRDTADAPMLSLVITGEGAQERALGEMYRAGSDAQARGETFSGCGMSLQNTSAEEQHEALGYGNQTDKESGKSEKLVWKDGVCRIENCPTRPGKTKVAQCSVCRGCQWWFDRGRDPAKLYKGLKTLQKTARRNIKDKKSS